MWADIDTKDDYLNYLEVAEVAAEIVLDQTMRPVSIGVFGTWGTGKSTLLNLIEAQLRRDGGDEVLVIRFDAWLYQGYDDARAALMDIIARKLYATAEHDAGLLGLAKRLLARVNTLRTLGLAVEVIAAAHGIPMFGAGAKAVSAVDNYMKGTPDTDDAGRLGEGAKAVSALIEPEKKRSPPEEIDAFRSEFRELLTGLEKTMVVFVDNLDRCLPSQTIQTLEALRLFLFMERSAFVVAADEDMVRYSVTQHFRDANARHVTDYLDKLIQVPIRVPRLGVTEIRTYLFLLFAEAGKVETANLNALMDRLNSNLRLSWREDPLSIDDALALLGKSGDALRNSFNIADRMAALLTSSSFVDGNPRIVKRMLNVVRMRSRIAKRRNMPIDEELVTKFALFERCMESTGVGKLYALINDAQAGKPRLITELEKHIDDSNAFAALCPDEWKKSTPFLWEWFSLKPSLAGVDLRPLVYLSRETTALRSHSVGLSQPAAQAVDRLRKITTLSSPVGKAAIQSIPTGEHAGVMRELIAHFRMHPNWNRKPDAFTGALLLAESDANAASQLSAFIRDLSTPMPPWLKASVHEQVWFKDAL